MKVCAGKKKRKASAAEPIQAFKGVKKAFNLETTHTSLTAGAGQKKGKAAVESIQLTEEFKAKWNPYPVDQQNIERIVNKPDFLKFTEVPLKEEEQISWLDFKTLDKGRPVIYSITGELSGDTGIWPIRLDHPFVPVIGKFAIDAFNELCEMHVKKNRISKLQHPEIMECSYLNLGLKWSDGHIFYIIIEAIEEGILGVYKTKVACDSSDGSKTFISFTLIDRTPVGKIAMAISDLISLKSRYKIMKGMKKDIEINLETTLKSIKGKKKKGKEAAKLIQLKEQHKAIKGKCNTLYRQMRAQIPKTWNERSSNPDGWCVPDIKASGFRERGANATCKGYDYHTKFREYSFL